MAEPCTYCGLPTGPGEFFVCGEPPRRHYFHVECMLEYHRQVVDSGEVDDFRVGINWPDGPAEIMTGKQLRQRQNSYDPAEYKAFIDEIKKMQGGAR